MPDTDAAHWDNYWQGRASHQSGNALIEVGIENNHALKQFWVETFSKTSKSAKIIDFACGAGSVLEHANRLGFTNLNGVDVSQKALDVMVEKIPTATGICSQVDQIPQEDNSFDLVVSQFGVEYAGSRAKLSEAFREMHRVLKPEGNIIIVAHAKNGIIYEGCTTSLKHAKIIEDSGFIEVAKKTISRLHDGNSPTNGAKTQKLMGRLNLAAEPIMEWLRGTDRSKNEFARFAYHLLESSHKLIANHNNFEKSDSLNWFTGVEAEIEAYKGRMDSMTKAALSQTDITNLIEQLAKRSTGLNFEPNETFYFSPDERPAAWVIRATKHP